MSHYDFTLPALVPALEQMTLPQFMELLEGDPANFHPLPDLHFYTRCDFDPVEATDVNQPMELDVPMENDDFFQRADFDMGMDWERMDVEHTIEWEQHSMTEDCKSEDSKDRTVAAGAEHAPTMSTTADEYPEVSKGNQIKPEGRSPSVKKAQKLTASSLNRFMEESDSELSEPGDFSDTDSELSDVPEGFDEDEEENQADKGEEAAEEGSGDESSEYEEDSESDDDEDED